MSDKKNLNLLAEKKGIIYEILQANDLEQTIACICDVFTASEPMTKAVGITPDEFYSFAKIYINKAVKDELSVVAKDKVNRKVLGFLISEDLISEPPDEIETVNAKFHPIMELLDQLGEKYRTSQKIEKGNHDVGWDYTPAPNIRRVK